jgi:hypothetical protein
MPRNPIVADVLQVEFLWSQDGIPGANVLHAGYTGGPPTSSDCAAIAELLGNAFWVVPLKADYPSTTTFVGVRVTDLATDTGASGEHAFGTAGTATDASLSAQACVLVNYSISRRYRGGHPRTYLPALAWGALATPGTWDSGVISDTTAVMNNLATEMGTATSGTTLLSGQVCVSYRTGNAWRVVNLVEPITGLSVNGRVCTQRRRLTASSY